MNIVKCDLYDYISCAFQDMFEAKNENITQLYLDLPDMSTIDVFSVFPAWKTLGTPTTPNLYVVNNRTRSALVSSCKWMVASRWWKLLTE